MLMLEVIIKQHNLQNIIHKIWGDLTYAYKRKENAKIPKSTP